jgi:two-component system sensor kinase FixL
VIEISYVTVVWSMIAAAACLLGFAHVSRWALERSSGVDLTFSVIAFAFVGVAIAEIGTMQATTPESWGQWVKWCHIPLGIMIIAIVVFVRQFLGSGRAWLAAALIATRLLILVIDLGSEPNINFDRIDSVRHIEFMGEPVTVVGEAITGRWQPLGTIASLLLAVFVLDATLSVWRRGGTDDRRRAIIVGGGLLFFVTVAAVYVQLVIWGVVRQPLLITPCFTVTLLAVAYELSRDALRASRLARELDASHRRLQMAVEDADLGLCEWDKRTGTVWATQRARTGNSRSSFASARRRAASDGSRHAAGRTGQPAGRNVSGASCAMSASGGNPCAKRRTCGANSRTRAAFPCSDSWPRRWRTS